MIGGVVVESKAFTDCIWVNCEENNSSSRCAVLVERTPDALLIRPGDQVWWQSGSVYWTPFDKSRVDVRIRKIGYSGVSKPKEAA